MMIPARLTGSRHHAGKWIKSEALAAGNVKAIGRNK
jgi:hypothetical protein